MLYKNLGSTGLSVSHIGLGGEWLNGKDKKTVKSIIETAIQGGINFFDFLFNEKTYITNIAKAIKDYREDLILQTHIGTGEKDGKPQRDRDFERNKFFFQRTLSKFNTDYVDILNIQFVREKEYENLTNKKGLLTLANQFKKEGKARFIGLSTHNAIIALNAIEDKLVDTIMFPLNMINHNLEYRSELLSSIKKSNIGLIGIKPFAGGKLLEKNHTVYIAKYQTGGLSMRKKIPKNISIYHCIHYCLNQEGVSTIIPGVHKKEELDEILQYFDLTDDEKNYSTVFKELLNNKFDLKEKIRNDFKIYHSLFNIRYKK